MAFRSRMLVSIPLDPEVQNGTTVLPSQLYASISVLMIRETGDVQLDNVARAVMANQNADCHVAIHYELPK